MRDAKHENKLGMFIHWGLYSMLGMHEADDRARERLDQGIHVLTDGVGDPHQLLALQHP